MVLHIESSLYDVGQEWIWLLNLEFDDEPRDAIYDSIFELSIVFRDDRFR